MAQGWTSFRLGDVCTKIGSGATPRGGSGVYLTEGEIALIRSQNVYNDGFHHDGIAYLTEDHAAELENVEVQEHDVLLNITGDSVARCCQVDPGILPARVNQHVAIIRPDAVQLDPRFLRYFLVSPGMQARMLSWAGAGGTRNALTKGMIESFEVPAPKDVAEQRAIAAVLGALDDKIELNRRMCRTLEGIARAVFRSWFVNFDPVHAKAAGAKSFRGMPQPVFNTLPAAFTDSPLGPIPKGWTVRPIGDVVDVVGGGTPSTEEPAYWEGGTHAFCTPKDMAGLTTPVLLKTDRCLTDAGVGRVSSGQLPPGTVLLSSRAPIGYLAIAEIPVSVNQGIIAMRCPREVPNVYVLLWAQANMDRVEANANGSTFQEISKRNFRPIPMLVPDGPSLADFGNVVEPMYRRIVAAEKQNRSLAAIRDALLPKLVSGAIRIRDAKHVVGRAG